MLILPIQNLDLSGDVMRRYAFDAAIEIGTEAARGGIDAGIEIQGGGTDAIVFIDLVPEDLR